MPAPALPPLNRQPRIHPGEHTAFEIIHRLEPPRAQLKGNLRAASTAVTDNNCFRTPIELVETVGNGSLRNEGDSRNTEIAMLGKLTDVDPLYVAGSLKRGSLLRLHRQPCFTNLFSR